MSFDNTEIIKKDSPRQRLRRIVDCGELRYALERDKFDREVVDLAVTIISRYCDPPPRRRRRV